MQENTKIVTAYVVWRSDDADPHITIVVVHLTFSFERCLSVYPVYTSVLVFFGGGREGEGGNFDNNYYETCAHCMRATSLALQS